MAKTAHAALVMLAVLGAAAGESRGQVDLAERLKKIVDARLAELRAELHAEIDAALGNSAALGNLAGVELVPVSEEFRELHRLPPGGGARVVSLAGSPDGEGLRVNDVIVRMKVPVAEIIRRGERMLVRHDAAVAPKRPAETADQMLDRLWNKAIRAQAPVALEPVGGAGGGTESRPTEKNPTPQDGPRR